MKYLISVIILLGTLTGCFSTAKNIVGGIVSPIQIISPAMRELYAPDIFIGYTGKIRPLEEVAIITQLGGIYITSINKNSNFTKIAYPKEKDTIFKGGKLNQFHLLPGTYEIEFCFGYRTTNAVFECSDRITKIMNLTPGQRLALDMNHPTQNTWSIMERPMESEELKYILKAYKKYVLNNV